MINHGWRLKVEEHRDEGQSYSSTPTQLQAVLKWRCGHLVFGIRSRCEGCVGILTDRRSLVDQHRSREKGIWRGFWTRPRIHALGKLLVGAWLGDSTVKVMLAPMGDRRYVFERALCPFGACTACGALGLFSALWFYGNRVSDLSRRIPPNRE
jgi:hypothetical protein